MTDKTRGKLLIKCDNALQAINLHSVLKEKGIAASLFNDSPQTIIGTFAWTEVKVYVLEKDYDLAKQIVTEYLSISAQGQE